MPAGPQQQFCWVTCRSTVVCVLQVLQDMAGADVQPLSTLQEAHLPSGAQLSGAGTEAEAPTAAALATGQWVCASSRHKEAVGSQKQGSHGLGHGLRTDKLELVERQQSSGGGEQHGSLGRQQGLQERQQGVEAQGQAGHLDAVPLAAVTEQFSSSHGDIPLQAAAKPTGPGTRSIKGPAHEWLTASPSSQTASDEGLENEVTGQGPHRSMQAPISSSSVSARAPAAAVGLPVMSLPAATPVAPPSHSSQAGTSRAKPERGVHPAAMAQQARAAGSLFGLGDRHRASLDRRPDLGAQARRPQSVDLLEKQRQAGGAAGLCRWAVFCLPHALQGCHLQAARQSVVHSAIPAAGQGVPCGLPSQGRWFVRSKRLLRHGLHESHLEGSVLCAGAPPESVTHSRQRLYCLASKQVL